MIEPIRHDWQRKPERDSEDGAFRCYRCALCSRWALMPNSDPRDPSGCCNIPSVGQPVRLVDGRTGTVGFMDMKAEVLAPYRSGGETFPIQSFAFDRDIWVQRPA